MQDKTIESMDARLPKFNEELKALQEKYKLKIAPITSITNDGRIEATLQAMDTIELEKINTELEKKSEPSPYVDGDK